MIKIALIGNYSIDYLKRHLAQKLGDIPHTIYVAGYDQVNQEILDSNSGLHRFKADIIFVMLQPDKLFPKLYTHDFFKQSTATRMEHADNVLHELLHLLGSLETKLVVNNLYIPFHSPLDILDSKNEAGMKQLLSHINTGLNDFAKHMPNVFIFDYCAFVGHYGHVNVFDNRFYYLAKTHERLDYLPHLAHEYMRYIYAALGMRKKCLVLDLDDTLWGGVIGEDGIAGITLARDGAGKAYWDFQQAILSLYDRGVVLALCSKNNSEEAMEAIDKHPDMLLRSEYFAAMQINWDDKASNIRKIAAELNLGLDSFVFIDNNPFERELVTEMLPEVTVVDMPEDAAYYADKLKGLNLFSTLYITEDDRKRNKQYKENASRCTAARQFNNIEEYLKSLEMELSILPADDFTIARAHQLINKTNQFNMTNIRYSMEQLEAMRNNPDWEVLCLRLKDKFGDNGIVGVVILDHRDGCEINTFLLSCRVLGRNVEMAVLDYLISLCYDKAVLSLRASFIPSKKNLASADVYPAYGFKEVDQDGNAMIYDITTDKPAKCISGLFALTI